MQTTPTYVKELVLPPPIVKFKFLEKVYSKSRNNTGRITTVLPNVEKYLNPELLGVFQSIGLTPMCLVAFERPSKGLSYIHRDITYKNNQWQPLPFAINWELNTGSVNWNWYDNTGVEEDPLPPPYHEKNPNLLSHGVNCKLGGTKKPEGFTLLDSYQPKVNQAAMYRIDIPHQVKYTVTTNQRRNISVRFSLDDVPTWQRALEIFEVFSS